MKNKHLFKLIALAICSVTMLSSCAYYTSTIKAQKALDDIQVGVVSQISLQEKQKKDVLNSSMKTSLNNFFATYYTIDNSILLEVNRIPKNIDDQYVNFYDNYYIAMLKSLGNTLSDDLKQQLSVGYYLSKLDMPRFVDINGSTVIGYNDLYDITFNVIDSSDNKYKLQVNVDINADVVKTEVFSSKYIFVPSTGYYNDLGTQFNNKDIDQYKIRASYYMDCSLIADKLLIDKLVEKTDFYIDKQKRHKKENNDFVSRLPYKDQPYDEEIKTIEGFFKLFYAQDYDSLKYYSDLKNTSYTLVNAYFETIVKAKSLVALDEATFSYNFPVSISPIKDNIIKIEKTDKITFKPCTDSSSNHQRYLIEIPVKANHTDGSFEDRIYEYKVEINKKSGLYLIEALEYVSSRPVVSDEPISQSTQTPTKTSAQSSQQQSETVNSLKDLGV